MIRLRHDAQVIANAIGFTDEEALKRFIIANTGRDDRKRILAIVPDIAIRAHLAAKEYMLGFDRRREIECRVAGVPPWANTRREDKGPSLTSLMPRRLRKHENRHRKRQQWLANHQARAEVNRARSNDPRGAPTWGGPVKAK